MNNSNKPDKLDTPLELGMAMAQNSDVMTHFAGLPNDSKQRII